MRGTTLIELLTVTSILSLLVALLLPAVQMNLTCLARIGEYSSGGALVFLKLAVSNWSTWGFLVCLFATTAIPANGSEPFLPDRDDQVLETLPRVLLDGKSELAALSRRLADDPENLELATEVAQQYLQSGNLAGDPRYYGYARAALKPWWEMTQPPSAVLALRAKLYEKEHRYEQSLADLRQIVERQPDDPQSWLEIANIHRVRGEYSEARRACESLAQYGGQVPATLGLAPIQAVTGEAQAASDSLAKILPEARRDWPGTVPFILTVQAQIASSLGKYQEAESHYLVGLKESPENSYLLRAYADLLLDLDRPQEALALLRDKTDDTGILLGAAIAAQKSGQQTLADRWQSELANRFAETRLRGDQPHGRFEARFALELQHNPRKALEIALDNWQKQKELRDTRNVLEAAAAVGDSVAVAPVEAFLRKHRTEDVRLLRLLAQKEPGKH